MSETDKETLERLKRLAAELDKLFDDVRVDEKHREIYFTFEDDCCAVS